jgi:hypothetical protein
MYDTPTTNGDVSVGVTMITASTVSAVSVSALTVSLAVGYFEHKRAERLSKELDRVAGNRQIGEDEIERIEGSLKPSYFD